MADPTLRADVTVEPATVADAKDIQVRVTLTNTSAAAVRVNDRVFPFASLALQVQTAAGTPVPAGPPPTPPKGEPTTRDIGPGKSLELTYKGSSYFQTRVPPGRYRVRFRYTATTPPGAWAGAVESDWAAFTVE